MNSLELDFEQARARHLLFKTRLRSILYGAEIDETPVVSHEACAVGKWIYEFALKQYDHIPEIHELEKVHAEVHKIARNLIVQYRAGNIEEARAGLSTMEITSGNLFTLLALLEMKVKAEGTFAKNEFSEKLSLGYNELLDLHKAMLELDMRFKEQALQASAAKKEAAVHEEKFRNTVKQAPVGITILRGYDMMVEMANETYLQLVGKTEESFVGRSLYDSLPEVKEAVEPLLNGVLKTGIPYYGNEFEVPIQRFGRTDTTYFNFAYQPLREQDGAITGIIVVANEVTAQVLSKKKLQESENALKNIIDRSPFSMVIFRGQDWIIETPNQELLKNIWKRELHEVEGKKLMDVFPELEGQSFPKLIRQVFDTGKKYEETEALAIIDIGGGVKKNFYLDFQYAPLIDTSGKVSGVMASVNDVTEKVEARNKINDAERSLRLAVEAADMGTFDWNFGEDVFSSSPRLKEIFGFAGNSNTTHQELINALHPDDKSIRDKAVEESIEKGNLSYEVRIIWPDQSIHWVSVYGKIIFTDDKTHRMYGTVIDITDQQKATDELKENEAKFRLLADSMPQFVWTGDAAGNLNYFNQSVFNYTGLTSKRITDEGWLQIVHPEDQEENMRLWMESVASGKDFIFEHRFKRNDGEYRWQLSRAAPQRSDSGKIQMWVGTSTDIHDHKIFRNKLELEVEERTRELTGANEALVKSNAELAQFAYVASHDLQEPLRKIQTFASRIVELESEVLSAKGKDYFARIQASSLRMQQLILDLLSYSSTSTNDKKVQVTDLNFLLQNVMEQLKERIESKGATIKADLLPTLKVVTFQFEQLLINILSNSLKYSKPDVPPVIIIKADIVNANDIELPLETKAQRYHLIKVSDNGIGFDPQFSERIFQVFQRLHGKDQYEGTGVGLAICKKIVENHQGYIVAEGETGKGASFTIYLPV